MREMDLFFVRTERSNDTMFHFVETCEKIRESVVRSL